MQPSQGVEGWFGSVGLRAYFLDVDSEVKAGYVLGIFRVIRFTQRFVEKMRKFDTLENGGV